MKKLLILLFSILISFNSYSKTICSTTDAQSRNGILYHQQQLFTGKDVCKYKNGQKMGEGNFKNGKRDGETNMWFEDGQRKAQFNFKDGKMDGKQTGWYDNDQIKYERYFKDGKEVGKWTSWRKNGDLFSINDKDL